MPNNDIEVFDYLIADENTAVEIDYLTYDIFAYKKKQWIDHFKKQSDQNQPNQGQIDQWIGQLSEYDFWQMRNEAAEFFHNSAEEHLKDYIEAQKKAAVDSSIVSEVKNFTSLWRHLG